MDATVLHILSNPIACQLTQDNICMEDLNEEHHTMLFGRYSENAGTDKAYHLACYHCIHLSEWKLFILPLNYGLYSNIGKAAMYKKSNVYSMQWLHTALGDILKG